MQVRHDVGTKIQAHAAVARYSMLAPTPPPHTITHSQSRPLRETLLLGLVVIGMMIVGRD